MRLHIVSNHNNDTVNNFLKHYSFEPYNFLDNYIPYELRKTPIFTMTINGIHLESDNSSFMTDLLISYFEKVLNLKDFKESLVIQTKYLIEDEFIYFKRLIYKYPRKNSLKSKKLI